MRQAYLSGRLTCAILLFLSWLSYNICSVAFGLYWLSGPYCPCSVLAVLPQLSCVVVLSQLPCSVFLLFSNRPVVSFPRWVSCHSYPVLTVLSSRPVPPVLSQLPMSALLSPSFSVYASCSNCPVCLSLPKLSSPGCPAQTVMSLPSCPGCPNLSVCPV